MLKAALLCSAVCTAFVVGGPSSAPSQDKPAKVAKAVSLREVLNLRDRVKQVRISTELQRYSVELVRATRSAPGVQLGASPRASLALTKAAQALALFDDLEFVTPEHIQELAVPVIAHRMMLDPQARFSGATAQTIVQDIIKRIPVPA